MLCLHAFEFLLSVQKKEQKKINMIKTNSHFSDKTYNIQKLLNKIFIYHEKNKTYFLVYKNLFFDKRKQIFAEF